MADKVGRLHVHELPSTTGLEIRGDVYRCNCKHEFFVDKNKDSGYGQSPKKWVELGDSPFLAEYDSPVGGKEGFIGKWNPEMDANVAPLAEATEEEPAETSAEENNDGAEPAATTE
jgi:hypothetical protein